MSFLLLVALFLQGGYKISFAFICYMYIYIYVCSGRKPNGDGKKNAGSKQNRLYKGLDKYPGKRPQTVCVCVSPSVSRSSFHDCLLFYPRRIAGGQRPTSKRWLTKLCLFGGCTVCSTVCTCAVTLLQPSCAVFWFHSSSTIYSKTFPPAAFCRCTVARESLSSFANTSSTVADPAAVRFPHPFHCGV